MEGIVKTKGKLSHLLILFSIGLIAIGAVLVPKTISAQVVDGYIGLEREFELAEVGIQSPTGLAYSPQADVFVFFARMNGQSTQSLVTLNRYEQLVAETAPGTVQVNPLGMAFNPVSNSLFALDAQGSSLLNASVDASKSVSSTGFTSAQGSLLAADTAQISGIAFDPVNGRMFLLDSAGPRLSTVLPDAQGGYTVDQTGHRLSSLRAGYARGLAFNPANAHLYTLDTSSNRLVELSDKGTVVGTYDLSSFGLKDPQGMVVAPSGDPTDDPANLNLYIADLGRNSILEFTFLQPTVIAAPSLVTVFSMVNTIQTSAWNPPSPDPMDIADMPNGNFLVTDSEVDELPIFAGVNVFEMTPAGAVVATCSTLAFDNEPAGVAVNHSNGMVFFTDDVDLMINMVDKGGDGQYCTNDDIISAFSTLAFNSIDPEGIAYWQGQLFIGDGLGKEIFRVRAGNNGVFDGVPPAGDDVVTSFDTEILGLGDPEGVAYHPTRNTLFIVSSSNHILVETTLDGVLLNRDNLRDLNTIALSGIAVGPSAVNPGQLNLFITDRAIDNMTDPNENDGRIYELSIGDTPVQTPVPTATATTVPPTPLPTATNTPGPTPTEGAPPAVRSIYLPFLSHSVP